MAGQEVGEKGVAPDCALVLEEAPDAMLVTDRGGRVATLNRAARALFGVSAPSMIGASIGEVFGAEGGVRSGVFSLEVGVPGAVRTIRADVSVSTLPTGEVIASVREASARDPEARGAEVTRMAQAERMAALGALSAGIAHEVNNPLTYVILRLDIIASIAARAARLVAGIQPEEGDAGGALEARKVEIAGLVSELTGHVATAKEGANRVRAIVGNLRVFARADSEPLMPVDVHGPLEIALELAHHELKHRATVVRQYGADSFVMGTEGKLAQIFLQLLLNASQAIEPGAPEVHRVWVRTRREGTSAIVEIEDTGVGIPAENVQRIFHPFFTTKPPETGMGLSMVHGIVLGLGGAIEVEPRAEDGELRGTRFSITLPIAPAFVGDSDEERDERGDLYYRPRDA